MRLPLKILPLLLLALPLSAHAVEEVPSALVPAAPTKDNRFFVPTAGYTRVRDLPGEVTGSVSSIEYRIYDALEGSVAHTSAEEWAYDVANKLHINTREATVLRRLPFRKGDSVTVDALRETEKNLRAEAFLADAIIEVKRLPDSTLAVKVHTYDQWTTNLSVSLSVKGGEPVWWVGALESNVLGTGQRLGFFIGHDLERDSRWIDYGNSAFTEQRLRLAGQYAWLSDGFSYSLSLSKPLRTRNQKWGFSLSASGQELSETIYLSANDASRLQDQGTFPASREDGLGQTYALKQWKRVATYAAYAGVTRAYGYSLKTSITPFYERRDRYNMDGFRRDSVMVAALGNPAYPLNQRHDEVLGATVNLYQYGYKTVQNFRNLKWSETIETGWRLSASVGQNQEWLGADNPDLYFSYTGVYNNAWRDDLFFNSNATMKYFVADGSTMDNGTVSGYAEAQWKPIPLFATVFVGQYAHYFAQPAGERLYLGEESGLLGFPNFYYGGQARFLATAEQRFFPPQEFGTIAPALALFLNAGNTYDTYRQVDLSDLHYAVGVGLRLGATRSTQKVVNHINLTLPLGEKNLSGVVFGIRAAKSL
jgi:outer membrane protein assembly factor BamA